MHLQIIISCHLCLFWCITLDAKELVGKTVPTPAYIGCYKETASGKTAMTSEATLWKENPTNATDCARFCRRNGQNYASLQFSRCFCGLSLSFVEVLDDAMCEGDCAIIQRFTVSYRVGKMSDGLRCGHRDVSAIYTVCPLHYYGEWCTENCNCLNKPCESKNGRCPGGICISGWSGQRCSIFKPCKTNPCQNGGECRPTDANVIGYICSCPYGFQGDSCEKGAEVLGQKVKVVLVTKPKEFYVAGIPYKADVPVSNRVYGQTSYVGCFPDPDSTDVPENFLEVSESMTVENCILHCTRKDEKFTVVAIKAGTQCRCANAYGKHGKGNESECNERCKSGKGKDYCGGAMANSIYTICPLGKYTTLCSMECHCADQRPCDLETGICDSGCIEGWLGKQCNKADLTDTYTLLQTVKMINILFAVAVMSGLGYNVYCYYKTYMAMTYDKEVARKAKEEEKEKKRKKEEKEMEEKKEKEEKEEREERRKRRKKRREDNDENDDENDDAYEGA